MVIVLVGYSMVHSFPPRMCVSVIFPQCSQMNFIVSEDFGPALLQHLPPQREQRAGTHLTMMTIGTMQGGSVAPTRTANPRILSAGNAKVWSMVIAAINPVTIPMIVRTI